MENPNQDILTNYLKIQAHSPSVNNRVCSDPPSLCGLPLIQSPNSFHNNSEQHESGSANSCDLDNGRTIIEAPSNQYLNSYSLFPNVNQLPLLSESSQLNLSTERKQKRHYITKNSGPNAQKNKKKRRLESNRISAQESRKKKKAYISFLETQVKQLKEQLDICRMKLAHCTYSDHLISVAAPNPISQFNTGIQDMIGKIVLGHELNDEAAVESTVKSLLIRYGIESEERKKVLARLLYDLLECSIPQPYSYLMWAANNDSGVFNPQNVCDKEVKKTAEGDFDEWNEVVDHIHLSDVEQMEIFKSKEFLVKSLGGLAEKMKKLVENKIELDEEIKRIDAYVINNIIGKLKGVTIGEFVRWFEGMKHKTELSITKLYGIKKEEFPGVIVTNSGDEDKPSEIKSSENQRMSDYRPLKRPKIN